MILKPGWIIALLMLWVVIQVLITIGDTSLSVSDLDQAPIVGILTTIRQFNTITGVFTLSNWKEILDNIWQIFTFQASFLTGAWKFVSYILTTIYAGLGLSLIYTFITR